MILVDTGVLLAAVNSKDQHHRESADLLDAHVGQLVTPATVVAETSWMIESLVGPAAKAAFVSSVAEGQLGVEGLGADDYRRCAALMEQYADLGLGLVDASVVTIAERLNLTTVATLNQRDFRVVRPRHCEAFELVP